MVLEIAPERGRDLISVIAAERGFVGAGEYRHLYDGGRLEVSGSLATLDKVAKERAGSGPRGHIRLKGETHASDEWRLRGEFYRTSDDGYLDLVGFDGSETLPSFAEAEGFFDRGYAHIGVFDVQELREGVSGELPLWRRLSSLRMASGRRRTDNAVAGSRGRLHRRRRGRTPARDARGPLAAGALHRRRPPPKSAPAHAGTLRMETSQMVTAPDDENNARLLPQASAGLELTCWPAGWKT